MWGGVKRLRWAYQRARVLLLELILSWLLRCCIIIVAIAAIVVYCCCCWCCIVSSIRRASLCFSLVSVPSEGDGCELRSELEEFSGYLSNRLPFVASRACGTKDSPWTIAVLSGQRINLTLHDFSTAFPRQVHGGQTTPCDLYALVQETDSASVTNICGSGLVQQLHVYTSAGSSLRVTLVPRKVNSTANFLISYEGTANSY